MGLKTAPTDPAMEVADAEGPVSFIEDANGQPVSVSTLKVIRKTGQ